MDYLGSGGLNTKKFKSICLSSSKEVDNCYNLKYNKFQKKNKKKSLNKNICFQLIL